MEIINYIYSHTNTKSIHPEVFCEKGIFKNFTKFAEKRLCHNLFLIMLKTLGLRLY